MATTGVERVKEHTFVKLNQPLEVKKLLKQRPEAIYSRDDYDQVEFRCIHALKSAVIIFVLIYFPSDYAPCRLF